MAEVGCSSPSVKLENFQDSNGNNDAFSFGHLDVYSTTSAPKNSASWTEALLGGGGSSEGGGGGGGGIDVEAAACLQSRFDEIVRHCFSKTRENEEATNDEPVQITQQDEQLRQNELWSKITKNFGNVLPVDWYTTHAKQLQESSLEIKETRTSQSSDLDVSDDEELQQAFDLHSLIISNLNHEPMFTAEQIISEIEGMLEDSPPASSDELDVFTPDLLKFRERSQELKKSLQGNLDGWPVRALSELYDELDSTVREYSEVLIQQLALRDELEYEKELMNQFISLHVNIQKKKRELQSDRKRGTTPTTESSVNISNLTTQIPYYPSTEPISAELFEVYVKILEAMDSDGSNLPTLLTDYILRVVCPTS